jgi:hypothetical protein
MRPAQPQHAPAAAQRPRRLLAKLEAAGAGLDEDAAAGDATRWAWLGRDRQDAEGRRPGGSTYQTHAQPCKEPTRFACGWRMLAHEGAWHATCC